MRILVTGGAAFAVLVMTACAGSAGAAGRAPPPIPPAPTTTLAVAMPTMSQDIADDLLLPPSDFELHFVDHGASAHARARRSEAPVSVGVTPNRVERKRGQVRPAY